MKRETQTGFFYGNIIVAAVFLIMVVIWAGFYSFGVFFKPILNEFGWNRALVSGAYSISSILMGLLGILMGWLNDKLGPRIVMTVSGFFIGTGYLLMSRITAVWQLYLFYGVVLGIGMGGSYVPIMTTVARWFEKKRGMMTGIVAAGVGIGGFIGPPLADFLISNYGWRSSYLVFGGTIIIVILLCAQVLKYDPFVIGQVPYGADPNDKDSIEANNRGLSLKDALGTGSFWIYFAMIFCLGYCVFSIMVHFAAHAMETGFSSARAAQILAAVGGASIVGKVVLGRVSDIVGNRNVFLGGFLFMALGLFSLIPADKIWMLICFALVFGMAYGGCVSVESPMVAELFGLGSLGLIIGVISFGFTVGGALGPWLTGYVFDITSSYRTAFFVCASLSALGLILTLFLKTGEIETGNLNKP